MRFAISGLSLVLCLASIPALAEWTLISRGDKGDQYFADLVNRKAAQYPSIWILTNYLEPLPNSVRSSKTLYQVNCYWGTIRKLADKGFDGQMADGNAVQSNDVTTPWRYVDPNTFLATLVDLLCDTKR